MSELNDKVKRSIDYIRAFQPDEPYYVCYSGGKDSDAIRILCELSNANYELHHNHTTVDAPETVYYVRGIVPKENIHKPERNMWKLIEAYGPPTRINRHCCKRLKESGGVGHVNMTGVRKAESYNRSQNAGLVEFRRKPKTTQKYAIDEGIDHSINKSGGVILNVDDDDSRRMVEHCYRTNKTLVNPILDWTSDEVWEFLHHYGCDGNPLYECGQSRVGCVGCPMASPKAREEEFERYPKYRDAYVRAFDAFVASRREREREREHMDELGWYSGEDVMKWWIH